MGNLVSGLTSAAPGIVATAIDPALGAAYWGAFGYGGGSESARLAGAAYGQQLLFGGANAVISALTNTFTLPRAFKAPIAALVNKGLWQQGIKQVAREGLKVLVKTAEMPAVAELQTIAQNAAQKGIFDSDMPWLGKGGVLDPQQMLEVAKNATVMSVALQFLGMGGKAGKYILSKINNGVKPDMPTAIRINKVLDAPVSPQAAEVAKSIDESAKTKLARPMPENVDRTLSGQQDKPIIAISVKLNKTFDINENVLRVSGIKAKSVADTVQSTGHTLAEGDLVELKAVNGKAIEAELYRGLRDISKLPASEKYHVMKYEGVGYEGKNPGFIRATDEDLEVINESKSGMAGKEEGNGEINTDIIPDKGESPKDREKKTRILGGAYKKVLADGGHVHHIPSKSVSPYMESEGPAIRMESKDHIKTSSYGYSIRSRLYRQKQRELIDRSKFLEAQQMDIDDIRLIFGDKYDEGVKQMQEYTKKLLNIE
jgi:hypothetical protein